MAIQLFPGQAFTANTLPTASFTVDVAGPRIANIQVTNSSYTVTGASNVSTAGGYIRVNGTGFVSGCTVVVGTLAAGDLPNVASAVSFVSSTQVNVQVPAVAAGYRTIFVVNPDGTTALRFNALAYS